MSNINTAIPIPFEPVGDPFGDGNGNRIFVSPASLSPVPQADGGQPVSTSPGVLVSKVAVNCGLDMQAFASDGRYSDIETVKMHRQCTKCKGQTPAGGLVWFRHGFAPYPLCFCFDCYTPKGGKLWPDSKFTPEFLLSLDRLSARDQLKTLDVFYGTLKDAMVSAIADNHRPAVNDAAFSGGSDADRAFEFGSDTDSLVDESDDEAEPVKVGAKRKKPAAAKGKAKKKTAKAKKATAKAKPKAKKAKTTAKKSTSKKGAAVNKATSKKKAVARAPKVKKSKKTEAKPAPPVVKSKRSKWKTAASDKKK